MLTVIAKLEVKTGQESEFAEAIKRVAEQVRTEPGNKAYRVHQAKEDPGLFMVYEQYQDQAALDAHREHMQSIGGELGSMLKGPPSLEFYREVE